MIIYSQVYGLFVHVVDVSKELFHSFELTEILVDDNLYISGGPAKQQKGKLKHFYSGFKYSPAAFNLSKTASLFRSDTKTCL